MAAAVETVKSSKRSVQAFIEARIQLVQNELEGFSGKLKTQVADLRKQLEGVPARVKTVLSGERFDKLKALLAKAPIAEATAQVEKVVADGVKLTEEAVEKLGLAKIADVSALKDAFDGLQKRIEQLKKKVDGLAKSASQAAPEDFSNNPKE
mgnify:CR=1 FL=1